MTIETEKAQTNIKSVSVACSILEVVARNSGPLSLKLISQRAKVTASKAHRYVQSLCACGLMSQAHKSGSYDLGLTALRIGLAAVNRVDTVNRASDALPSLVENLDADAFISVWSNLGPTVVRFERSRTPSVSMLGPGVAFPIFTSATGLVFLAHASPAMLHDVVQEEIRNNPELREKSTREIAEGYNHIKEEGYAYTIGAFLQGRQCVAAPILSLDNRIIAAVTFVSTNPGSVKPDSREVKLLMQFCAQYSLPKKGYLEETLIEQRIAV